MAYAQLAGLPPYIGSLCFIYPGHDRSTHGFVPAAGNRAGGCRFADDGRRTGAVGGRRHELYIAYAAILAVMVGLFQVMLGVFRLGVLVDFLSHPVVVGFTNGAAIIIATSQLSNLFGVSVEKAEHHYETVWRVLVAASQSTHMLTLLMGITALAIMILLRKYLPKIPNVLTAVAVTTAGFMAFWFSGSRR